MSTLDPKSLNVFLRHFIFSFWFSHLGLLLLSFRLLPGPLTLACDPLSLVLLPFVLLSVLLGLDTTGPRLLCLLVLAVFSGVLVLLWLVLLTGLFCLASALVGVLVLVVLVLDTFLGVFALLL